LAHGVARIVVPGCTSCSTYSGPRSTCHTTPRWRLPMIDDMLHQAQGRIECDRVTVGIDVLLSVAEDVAALLAGRGRVDGMFTGIVDFAAEHHHGALAVGDHAQQPPVVALEPGVRRAMTRPSFQSRTSSRTSASTCWSLVLPGQHQHRTGMPSRVTARPMTICGRSGRWSLEWPNRRNASAPYRWTCASGGRRPRSMVCRRSAAALAVE
jgi:hypothetical protein